MDPDGQRTITQLALLVALTAVNAFFACAEMATVSVNKNKINRLAEEGNKNALLVQNLLKEPTRFLSTIQVAITLSGFFASGSAATGISKQLGAVLNDLGISGGEQISFVAVTIILSYFTLVFGELVPKRFALQKAETISMFCVRPILLISKIASPFIRLLSASTSLILKLCRVHTNDLEEKVSEEELRALILSGEAEGVFNETEADMLTSIFTFDDKLAKEIMTPRVDVFALDLCEPFAEQVDALIDAGYSRIPLYEEDIDNIVGILYLKDLVAASKNCRFADVDIRSILHKPYFVPESKKIDELFDELRSQKKYMALLVDEYGGFSGLVTIEDLVEEVMGEIEDEFDEGSPDIVKQPDGTYLVDGLVSLNDLNEELGLALSSENYDTISGYVIDLLGSIPNEKENRSVTSGTLTFTIESMKEKRIKRVRLAIAADSDDTSETDSGSDS
ncbi:MAG: HlyC/CorC family transporter [Lachnospiraceae bacterium]|nr:HlyC/CorC family transporter [Lachnospiraceae bacterium]